jgi:hypothetical protein
MSKTTNEIDYLAILELFTADDELGRYILTEPFIHEHLAAATNGHIACVLDRSLVDLPDNEPDEKFPNVTSVYPKDLPEPLIVDPALLHNAECEEALRLRVDCDRCDGGGEHECRCGDEHECGICKGLGTVGPPAPIALLSGKPFNYSYLRIIREAAKIAGSPEVRYFACGPDNVSVFEFDKVRCAVMPMRSDSIKREYPELLGLSAATT